MGDLSLKPWLANNQGLALPPELDLATVEPMAPYNEQIHVLRQQLGAQVARRNMKDCSGASKMDPSTQITSVHGISVLDLALEPLEANFALPLVHEIATENDRALLDVAVAGEVNLVDDPILIAADAARHAGNAPNSVMAAAVSIVGPKRVERTRLGKICGLWGGVEAKPWIGWISDVCILRMGQEGSDAAESAAGGILEQQECPFSHSPWPCGW